MYEIPVWTNNKGPNLVLWNVSKVTESLRAKSNIRKWSEFVRDKIKSMIKTANRIAFILLGRGLSIYTEIAEIKTKTNESTSGKINIDR